MSRAKIAFLALGLAFVIPGSALGETCLQKFSCKLYGECRFPCLDAMLSSEPAPTPVASEDRIQHEGKAVAVSPNKLPRFARRETRKPHIHLVTADDISSLDQLAGKIVSFGPQGSASQVAGRKLFAKLGVKVNETPLDLDNALDGVATGDVAAVVVLRPRDLAKAEAVTSEGAVASGE